MKLQMKSIIIMSPLVVLTYDAVSVGTILYLQNEFYILYWYKLSRGESFAFSRFLAIFAKLNPARSTSTEICESLFYAKCKKNEIRES